MLPDFGTKIIDFEWEWRLLKCLEDSLLWDLHYRTVLSGCLDCVAKFVIRYDILDTKQFGHRNRSHGDVDTVSFLIQSNLAFKDNVKKLWPFALIIHCVIQFIYHFLSSLNHLEYFLFFDVFEEGESSVKVVHLSKLRKHYEALKYFIHRFQRKLQQICVVFTYNDTDLDVVDFVGMTKVATLSRLDKSLFHSILLIAPNSNATSQHQIECL